ncbi:ABC transporter related protein [Mahella australiensis 50-1 BON]|uniref:ABC transporter related protein n=2 Tax=Mahella TaxID=252965 RepID=F4A151_MAHA5|nr:ABC transporter related protein [Mahella australiensis 50-1 BON]
MQHIGVDGMEYILEARDLSCAYDQTTIIEHLDLAIERSSMVGILGPNGSGKTTLLRHISAALKPRSGVVLLNGVDVFAMRRRMLARKIAYVPQSTAADFEFSAMDVVMMGRIPYMKGFQSESHADMSAVKQAMDMTGTWQFRDRSITELSGGELQRVMIARALAQQPEILMLDEPTAHLDLQFQMEILDLLRQLVDHHGLTVIVVLHDINLAVQFCDKVVFMQSGSIIADGRPQDVITEQLISDVYNVAVSIWHDEATGSICIAPVRQASSETSACLKRIG